MATQVANGSAANGLPNGLPNGGPLISAEPAQTAVAHSNSSLYVGDLDRDVTESQIFEMFSQVRVCETTPSVTSLKLVRSPTERLCQRAI